MKRILISLFALAAVSANAWDGTGHMLVAQFARDRMSSQTVARVDALAAKLDNNGVPYNGVTIACWPDDIKDRASKSPFQGQFRTWHYIDIGCGTNDPDAFAEMTLTKTNGNIVAALPRCVEAIKQKKFDDLIPNESVALALVMHFVGDIHQPLHTTARYNPDPKPDDKYKDDAGGNGLTVANLGDTPWGKNLHTFWDEAYRRHFESGEVKALPALHEATALGSAEMKEWMSQLESLPLGRSDLSFDAKRWALETHAIACAQVYGTLGEPYGAKNIKLSEKYVTESNELARHQLVLAGHRLAVLLEDLYGR